MPNEINIDLDDKLLGMFLFGAYGDALGSPREKEAIKGQLQIPSSIGKLVNFEDYGELKNILPDKWGLWSKESILRTIRGIPTDDTAFRLLLLHRWIDHSYESSSELTEVNFKQWMTTSVLPPPYNITEGVKSSYSEIIAEFEHIFYVQENYPNVSEEEIERSFYKNNRLVFFGNFMYLELVATKLNSNSYEVIELFNSITNLDITYGKTITAISAGILHRCLLQEYILVEDIYDFLKTTTLELLDIAIEIELNQVEKLREDMLWAIGKAEQSNTIEDLLQEFSNIYLSPQEEKTNGLVEGKFYAHHPLLMWRQIWAGLAFYKNEPFNALTFTAVCYGDTDTVSSFLGIILGGLCGNRILAQSKINNYNLDDILSEIEQNIIALFNVDLRDNIDIFKRFYQDGHIL